MYHFYGALAKTTELIKKWEATCIEKELCCT
jgi:hypothetical protein